MASFQHCLEEYSPNTGTQRHFKFTTLHPWNVPQATRGLMSDLQIKRNLVQYHNILIIMTQILVYHNNTNHSNLGIFWKTTNIKISYCETYTPNSERKEKEKRRKCNSPERALREKLNKSVYFSVSSAILFRRRFHLYGRKQPLHIGLLLSLIQQNRHIDLHYTQTKWKNTLQTKLKKKKAYFE